MATYPLHRITYNRKTISLPLGFNLHEKDFDAKINALNPRTGLSLNTTRLKITNIQEKLKKEIYDTIIQLEGRRKNRNLSMPSLKKATKEIKSWKGLF